MPVNVKGPPRKRLSLTSLIDVIFLLLLFFMLTSTFSKFGEIELTSAAEGAGGDDRQMLFLQLSSKEITLNGQPVELSRLGELISLQPQDGRGHLALVSSSAEATSQQLIDLLSALRHVEGLQAMVLS
ncbi:ExbD/TolR family protein [Phaeobacter porticola]|uniref:Outer membrane transport energization protein ExbD n=1 Tax=Phaeobacter porticola TaxID=1844006 RepID=A0A1L3IA79_9RHOB|nr:biopolymer transporter ExbD [Phaeobacter porticola]APG49070.1 outer membrane transport energization protein ExbD [Phaeobacter porticola]